MLNFTLSPAQEAVAAQAGQHKVFLEGPAGSGKTTAGTAWLRRLLAAVPAERVLVLTPQRTLDAPYRAVAQSTDLPPGGQVTLATFGGLARRMIDLFWPLVAAEAGFAHPHRRPIFLTLETAQYYMTRIVTPLIEEQGYFDSVTLNRNRLCSQIIDNLNKAAMVGFPYTEIATRLKGAWIGESAQGIIYEQAQTCATRFRRYCLEHNLLDFSLQMEIFSTLLWHEPLCRTYLQTQYRHLVVDNVEEDTPVAHDILYNWLPETDSALLIYDQNAGYRAFLGADPISASTLRDLCDHHVTFTDSWVTSPAIESLNAAFEKVLQEETPPPLRQPLPLRFELHRYHPQMLDWVADEIASLVRDGTPPGEIVVIAPFLSDALRFSLSHRLKQRAVPVRSHRPSRALRDEPVAQALLTLAALAHPDWGIVPTRYDAAYALVQAIGEMDLIRAQLLVDILYRVQENRPRLQPFEGLKPEVQSRITYLLGGRYEGLREWLDQYITGDPTPLDHFLARLFGELLSQPGYGFYRQTDAGHITAMLIESIRKFRSIVEQAEPDTIAGRAYVQMVHDGVVAAQYLRPWQAQEENAVLLAPAYTFLLYNRPVEVQFWLNVGSGGWWERLYQPLTHPYVLSRRWPMGQPWDDTQEVAARNDTLLRLIQGLLHRCRRTIYLGISELGEGGFEQSGPLLKALQRILRHAQADSGRDH